jgi:hypothetical protein
MKRTGLRAAALQSHPGKLERERTPDFHLDRPEAQATRCGKGEQYQRGAGRNAVQGRRALREGLAAARREGARLFGLRVTLRLARLEAG